MSSYDTIVGNSQNARFSFVVTTPQLRFSAGEPASDSNVASLAAWSLCAIIHRWTHARLRVARRNPETIVTVQEARVVAPQEDT